MDSSTSLQITTALFIHLGVSMIIEIDGRRIHAELDFHAEMSEAFGLSSSCGKNLDALWDVFSTGIERPLVLIWNHSAVSRIEMSERFDAVVGVLRKLEVQDAEWGLPVGGRFELVLR